MLAFHQQHECDHVTNASTSTTLQRALLTVLISMDKVTVNCCCGPVARQTSSHRDLTQAA